MRMDPVIPAKAGAPGRKGTLGLPEAPAFGFPSKYYFDGVHPGVTISC
jgi:hypothetical protein